MNTATAHRGAITDAAYELPHSVVQALEEHSARNGWSLAHTLYLAAVAFLDNYEGVRW